ncbi:MAG: FGGY family carbohydrate kinase [Kiritimatiellia bacterium]
MSGKKLFAVDLGASGGKCFAGIFEGDSFSMREVHRFEHEGVTFFIPDGEGRVTQRDHWDDVLLYDNIVKGLQTYRREFSDHLDTIGIDTWGADGHFVNPDGEMLGKIYCYRDHRLDNMIDEVKSRIDPRRVYEITGIHFQPFNVSNQLRWFVRNRRDLIRPGSSFLPIPTVFYYYLGGAKKVDSSWASVTQLMDARKKEWSEEILRKLEIPPEVMPEIVEPGTVIGKLHKQLAESTGINQADLMAVGAHDTASAFAAAPIQNASEALIISSGTWSLVGKLVPEPITSEEAMDANVSNEGGIGNTRCLLNCMGTWLVQELRRNWAREDGREMSWEEITRLASSAPPFGSLVDPDDASFYNPDDMQKAIADFCGRTAQPVPSDRGAFLRLVYESLALKYRVVNERICSVSDSKTTAVNIVGGGSKNDLLNRLTASAVGLPVVAGPEEATAAGNLMVQARGLGIINSMEEALPIIKQAFPIREYRPEDSDAWKQAYDRFVKILS